MELKEILEIDTEPFSEDILEDFIFQDNYSASTYSNHFEILIMRYFYLFNQKYQIGMERVIENNRMLGIESTDYEDEIPWYYEDSRSLMDYAIGHFGWDFRCFNVDSIEVDNLTTDCFDSEEGREKFNNYFLACLKKFEYDPKVIKMFLQEGEIAFNAHCGLEEGEIWIIYNEKLSNYLQLREQHQDIIEKICKVEDMHIHMMESTIWEPLYNCFYTEKKNCDGEPYLVLITGYDGYSGCGEENFNPNWVCRAYVFNELLDLVLKKLENYMSMAEIAA